jgi:hypothetical protein
LPSAWTAYRRRMRVNSALPSRCLQRTLFSTRALSVSCNQMVPLPFRLGYIWTSCHILSRTIRTRSVSVFAPQCSAIKASYCLSKDANTAHYLVSHWVGPAIFPFN